jgi:alpha-L-fucosidase
MGPEKDLIGMWKEATLKAGLKFGVTTHLSRSVSWMNVSKGADTKGPLKGVPYDGVDPEYAELYHAVPYGDTHQRAAFNAPKEWQELWANRVKDLIDNYDPDHLYFDCAIPFRGDDMGKTGMDVIAHYYNKSIERNGELGSVMCIKERPWQGLYADGVATLDFERGKAADIRKEPWQTDDSMGPWGYRKGADYMSADATIDKLIDIVSKNGNLLLNVPIMADGTLDAKTTEILKDIGKWMTINGEAIYGTRPWYMFGEGKTNEIPHHVIESPYTDKDIRYTTKGDILYALVLDWPKNGREVVLEHLAPGNSRIGEIASVSLIGHNGSVEWEHFGDGLKIKFPKEKPCEFAYALKISFSD